MSVHVSVKISHSEGHGAMTGIVLHCHSYQWVSISQDKESLASVSLLEESSMSDV